MKYFTFISAVCKLNLTYNRIFIIIIYAIIKVNLYDFVLKILPPFDSVMTTIISYFVSFHVAISPSLVEIIP